MDLHLLHIENEVEVMLDSYVEDEKASMWRPYGVGVNASTFILQ